MRRQSLCSDEIRFELRRRKSDERSLKARRDPATAASRALAEAAERRAAAEKAQQAAEIGGREGPDPARYGDWEVKGIASDF